MREVVAGLTKAELRCACKRVCMCLLREGCFGSQRLT